MRNPLILMTVVLVAVPLLVAAGAASTATAVVCTGVKDRAPVGAAERFPATIGQLTCFSEVHGVNEKVVHVWFHGDNEVGKIELPVKAERWRTWSSKTIPAKWTGAWRVEVQDAAGTILATAKFSVE